tara:strand:- start:203 stop:577 length:375 start_codon:yes stop_codon:yes gene_type:complete
MVDDVLEQRKLLISKRNALIEEIADVKTELTRVPIDRMWKQHLIRARATATSKLVRVDAKLSDLRAANKQPAAIPRSDDELRAERKELRKRLTAAYNEIERLRGYPASEDERRGDWQPTHNAAH